jgi:hypothetical protein
MRHGYFALRQNFAEREQRSIKSLRPLQRGEVAPVVEDDEFGVRPELDIPVVRVR